MCRSIDHGGRRCPYHASARARLAHNERRRENRSLRIAIVSWADHQGVPAIARSVLAYAPPHVAREWGIRAGAPTRVREVASRIPGKLTKIRAHWATPALIDAIAATGRQQGEHRGERHLLDAEISEVDYAEEMGVNTTKRVVFTDASDAYHKPFQGLDEDTAYDYGHREALQPIHETAAWVLARNLGGPWDKLVPPAVLRPVEGELGSLAEGRPGAPGDYLLTDEDTLDRAAFFDALTGQQDRHGGNMLNDGPRLTLIDHGFAFATPDDQDNNNVLVVRRHRLGREALEAEELDALRRLLDSDELFGLQQLLEPERAAALRDRAARMLDAGVLLPAGEF